MTVQTALFDERYHVPRSQVWTGSRGAQTGLVHLHVRHGEAFQAGRIRRIESQALCGRRGWYERQPGDGEELCPRCVAISARDNGIISELIR